MEAVAFTSLLLFKFKKILLNKRIAAALLVGALVVAVMVYASTLDVIFQDGAVLLDALVISFFLPVIAMFYGSSVIRDEIEDMSITMVIASPMNRYTAYIAYYTALVVSLLIVMLGILASGFLAFYLPFGVSSEAIRLLGNMALLVFLGCLVYSSLFLLASVLLERSIYFGLFYAFIWEGFIGSIPGRISEFSIKHYIRSIGSGRMEFMEFATASSVSYSYVVLAAVFLLLILGGTVMFGRKEFPG